MGRDGCFSSTSALGETGGSFSFNLKETLGLVTIVWCLSSVSDEPEGVKMDLMGLMPFGLGSFFLVSPSLSVVSGDSTSFSVLVSAILSSASFSAVSVVSGNDSSVTVKEKAGFEN